MATALKENPQVQIATLSFAESQQNKSIARSALLPQAGVEVLDRAERFNLYSQFGSRFPGHPRARGPIPVFSGGAPDDDAVARPHAVAALQAAHQGMSASQAQETTVREQVVLLVVSQYLAGMRAECGGESCTVTRGSGAGTL